MASSEPYLRALLLRRSDWIESRMVEAAERNGYGFVTPAMNRLFSHMGGRPAGISELARRMAISRQAVHQVAREAARNGVIEFVDSPADGRVKQIRFTAKGWEMSDSAAQCLRAIEAELAERVGPRDLAELKRILAAAWTDDEVRDVA